MIDCISGGRLIAGFPVGTPMDDCFAYGQNPSQLRERYYEAHDLVMKAWQHPDTFAFNGRYNQQRYVNIWPRPVIPASAGVDPRGRLDQDMAVVRREGLRLFVSVLFRPQGRGAPRWTATGRKMDRLGKDRNPYRAGFAQTVAVAVFAPAGDRHLHRGGRGTSSCAACTSIRASPRRPVTPRKRPRVSGPTPAK